MKKIYIVITALILFLLPVGVKAYGMDRFYMQATILPNGDIEVEEFFDMSGNYNGFERIINFSNMRAIQFDQNGTSFGGSSIHNGNGITIEAVKGVDLKQIKNNPEDLKSTFQSIGKYTDLFSEVEIANNGDYGKYTKNSTIDGVVLKMYNSRSDKGFYIKYILKDMGIVHQDVAEIGWNIFSDQMSESINDFRLIIHIPNNQTELRAWAHGPLTGNVKPSGKNDVLVDIRGLDAKTAMDTRVVFDKSVLFNSVKQTGVEALPSILNYETEKANEANQERELAKKEVALQNVFKTIGTIVEVLWLIGLGIILFIIYHKYDKEYKTSFTGKYFRDFPSDLDPTSVGYLMNHKVGTNDFSAEIMNLINQKKIIYEKLEKENYKLSYDGNKEKFSSMEQLIIAVLFEDGEVETTLSEFKKRAKSSYQEFLENFDMWKQTATLSSSQLGFFENQGKIKGFAAFYCILGLVGSFLIINHTWSIIFPGLIWIASLGTILYSGSFFRRTVKGNEEYQKWNALKNFINDFGQFKEKELPQIELWEKYLVYAVTFGSAEKLAKQMEIKVKEYNVSADGMPYYYGHNHFTNILLFNHIMNRSVQTAHSSAVSARDIANSSSSSSGGFGGGFSGGGGSFGGGGGGGRF